MEYFLEEGFPGGQFFSTSSGLLSILELDNFPDNSLGENSRFNLEEEGRKGVLIPIIPFQFRVICWPGGPLIGLLEGVWKKASNWAGSNWPDFGFGNWVWPGPSFYSLNFSLFNPFIIIPGVPLAREEINFPGRKARGQKGLEFPPTFLGNFYPLVFLGFAIGRCCGLLFTFLNPGVPLPNRGWIQLFFFFPRGVGALFKVFGRGKPYLGRVGSRFFPPGKTRVGVPRFSPKFLSPLGGLFPQKGLPQNFPRGHKNFPPGFGISPHFFSHGGGGELYPPRASPFLKIPGVYIGPFFPPMCGGGVILNPRIFGGPFLGGHFLFRGAPLWGTPFSPKYPSGGNFYPGLKPGGPFWEEAGGVKPPGYMRTPQFVVLG